MDAHGAVQTAGLAKKDQLELAERIVEVLRRHGCARVSFGGAQY